MIFILYLGSAYKNIQYNSRALLIKILFAVIYLSILHFNSKKRSRYYIFGVVLLAELIVGNFNLVNERENLSQNDYENLIEGETQQLLNVIVENDQNPLYRVRAYDFRSYLNHSSIGKYAGTNSYSSLNKKYTIDFLENLKEADSAYAISKDKNHADLSNENFTVQTLLGVKYIITNAEPPIGYELYDEEGDTRAYRNTQTINMGYICDQKMNEEDYLHLSPLQKNLALFHAYYISEKETDRNWRGIDSDFQISDVNGRPLENGEIYGRSGGDNSIITIRRQSEGTAVEMVVEMTVPNTGLTMKIFYADEDEEFCEDKVSYRYLIGGKRLYSLYLDDPDIAKIAMIPVLDPKGEGYEFTIHNISFVDWNHAYADEYLNSASALSKNCVRNPSFINDKYHASCFNDKEGNMLIIPMNYSINWTAFINGEKVEVCQVNDAFCGLRLPLGACEIEMKYSTYGQNVWVIISLFCLAALLKVLADERNRSA